MRIAKKLSVVTGLVVGAAMFGLAGCGDGGSVQGKSDDAKAKEGKGEVVVYCAHDSIFSEGILDAFEEKTGIDVKVKFDTEATKSLGLTELLIAEKDHPKADVFWNNQLLGTADLASKGVLESYKGEGWKRMPEGLKDKDGLYTGFAGRMRVTIYNTNKWKSGANTLKVGGISRISSEDYWVKKGAIAKPLYGTTLSHYAVMWDIMGENSVKQWHNDWRERGVVEKGGNSTVKNLVAENVCQWGYTDTDDFYVAKDAGKSVGMYPVWVYSNETDYSKMHAEIINGVWTLKAMQPTVGFKRWTICIPNTVGLVKGAKNDANAKLLIDYLLSEEVELALAASKARQIPLGDVDESKLSDEVKQLKAWAKDAYPIADLLEERNAALQWLKEKYLN
ncbi:extracellular solute-binding protein [Planctomycetota bacterium]|nr:extracellular solute-binding protein [Planctomycetota bacterium]